MIDIGIVKCADCVTENRKPVETQPYTPDGRNAMWDHLTDVHGVQVRPGREDK